LLPRSKWEAVSTIGGFVAAAASASLATPGLAVVSILSFGFWLMQAGSRAAEKASVKAAPYRGPKLPFFLAFGSTQPTVKQIRELSKKLEELY